MLEAELTSDLLVSIVDGVQTNKNIELHYRTREDEFPEIDAVEEKFDSVMTMIAAVYPPDQLAPTNWSRIHLFYTLFTALGHAMYGLDGLEEAPRPPISLKNLAQVRVALDDISSRYDYYTEQKIAEEAVPRDFADFILRSRRATTDTGARVARAKFVCRKLVEALQ